MPGLKEIYRKQVVPGLLKDRGYRSVMQVPRLQKVVINIGAGEAVANAKVLEAAEKDLAAIAGQHPVITRARRSISAFKLRAGMPIGIKVTLRGDRMFHFLDKLINVTLPRIREFQGIPADSFDGYGNYTLGLKDQTVFPEINFEEIDKQRGIEICIVTTARTDEEGKRLLEMLGVPFSKD